MTHEHVRSQIASSSSSSPSSAPVESQVTRTDDAIQQWETEYARAEPQLRANSGLAAPHSSLIEGRALRVHQLDAEHFDREISGILSKQFMQAFTFFRDEFVERYKPELEALFSVLLYHFSVWTDGYTPGQQLENLRYSNERLRSRLAARGASATTPAPLSRFQKLSHCFLLVGGQWALARWNRHSALRGYSDLAEGDWRKRVWHAMRYLENAYQLLWLVNFLLFLYDGKYVSPITRLLSMRLVYARKPQARYVNFDFMNQQLFWQHTGEFLLFLMPLISFNQLFALKNFFARPFAALSKSISSGGAGNEGSSHAHATVCPICGTSAIIAPYVSTPCGHMHCYYCIKVACMQDSSYCCVRCNQRVVSIERYVPS